MENKMFCFQCQETAGCKGCTQVGVCGKKPEVAAMQDLLIYVTKGLSAVTTRLRAEGKQVAREVNHLVTKNLFITITNANFDREAIIEAGVTRLRPILMTSLTTVLGLTITALAKNAGTALMQPVALVCIGGLLYATLMTLFVVPCMYDIVSKKEPRRVDEKELELIDL